MSCNNCCSCRKVKCCLGISSTGDEDLFLNQQGDWVSPASGSVFFFENGLTESSNTVKLGGTITENTTLDFDPTINYIVFGDLVSPVFFGFGNLNNDAATRFNIAGLDSINISGSTIDLTSSDVTGGISLDSANEVYVFADNQLFTEVSTGSSLLFTQNELNIYINRNSPTPVGDIWGTISYSSGNNVFITTKEQDWNAGYYNWLDGAIPRAQLFYAEWDGSQFVDITRIEANNTIAHGRKITNTATGAYNGWHVEDSYTQLEYQKTGEDGQTTGTCWTLDANGASLYVGGVLQFRIKNTGIPSYADDAAAIGAGLVSNEVYKTTTGGSTFLKIVP